VSVLEPAVDWKLDAACRGTDPDLFFPERGEATWPAKAICADCPVADDCLDAGMWEKFGIWGGLSERQRRRHRAGQRRRVLAATADAAPAPVPAVPAAMVVDELEAARRARAAVGTEPNGGHPRMRGKAVKAWAR
jgi:WhiB family transcriptional regulator, redox-sensing transcriptional regulator